MTVTLDTTNAFSSLVHDLSVPVALRSIHQLLGERYPPLVSGPWVHRDRKARVAAALRRERNRDLESPYSC